MNKITRIRKDAFCRFVSNKINNILELSHICSVINILLDEMIKDLTEGKSIEIYNFGTLELKKIDNRPYHNINNGQLLMSKGQRAMRFTLLPKIKNIIKKNLDIEKTFEK